MEPVRPLHSLFLPAPLRFPMYLVLLAIAYLSVFWADWRLVSIGVGVYYLQQIVINTTYFARFFFPDQPDSVRSQSLSKAIKIVSPDVLEFIIGSIIPLLLIIMAWLWQDGLGHMAWLIRIQ